jgi:hypothetical protein
MRYLLPSAAAAFNERWAACAGYTHLIGGAKRNEKLLERLEHRVRRDYPGYYERCVELAPDLVLASTA